MSTLSKTSNFGTSNCITDRRSGIINRANIKYSFMQKRNLLKAKMCYFVIVIFLGEKVSYLCPLCLRFPKYFPCV